MTMESVTNTYVSHNVILQFPDDYVARPQFFDEQSSLAVKENGRFIIKAGTPFPSNDSNCTGIVLNDIDVTNGDANGAVLVRGHINTARAEANAGITYSSQTKTALKNGIFFYPLGGSIVDTTVIKAYADINAQDVDPVITLKLQGTDFAPKQASTKVANYAIDAGTTSLTASTITRVDDKTVKIACTGTAVAGTFKVKVKAAAVVNGIESNEVSIVIS